MTVTAPVRAGVPARFDASSQHRRAMLGKVHIARKQLNMCEDDYRQALLDQTGKASAADCSERELGRLLAWLESKGFKPLGRPATNRVPQFPAAKKARALWISLYHLGVVHNASEQALEAFACRQLKCERFMWARQSEAFRLIEALKAMAERAGWRQRDMNGKQLSPLLLASSLCQCILGRLRELGVAPDGWGLEEAAFRLCGAEIADELTMVLEHGSAAPEHFHRLAAALGAKLREVVPHAAHEGDGQ